MKKTSYLITLVILLTLPFLLIISCSKDKDGDKEDTDCSVSVSLAGTVWTGVESRSEEQFTFDGSHYSWKIKTDEDRWVEDEKGPYCFDGTNGRLNRKSRNIRFKISGNVLTLSMEDQASEDPFIKED